MAVAIIMPVLNEGARIEHSVSRALEHDISELIVVDGGSNDDTRELASAAGARVLSSPRRGRGYQLNFGARFADADTLLFLHADVTLPPGALTDIDVLLSKPSVVAGAFRVRHVPFRWRDHSKARLLRLADIRSRYSKLPYGDQGLFLRRRVFEDVGGFPDIALMEDLEMARQLSGLGKIAVSTLEVHVSARRIEAQPMRQTILMNTFPSLYRLGVPPSWLARLYGDPR